MHARLAMLGALAWAIVPFVPLEVRPGIGSVTHGFLLFPLVAAPLGLALAQALLRPEGTARVFYDAARRVQPFASAAVLAAFFVPTGALAGVLVVPWIAMALLLASGAFCSARRAAAPHLGRMSLLGAHVFLPIGSVWLLLWRLGTGPGHLSSVTVMLAALHFHFSGFALQMLIAATARRVPPSLARLQQAIAIAGVVGIPLIAVGNLVEIELLKTLGVATVVLGSLGIAAMSIRVALPIRDMVVRRLLICAGGSLGAAMLLASVFRTGLLLGTGWIEVETMVATHGLLNAFGFVVCGAVGHLRLTARPA